MKIIKQKTKTLVTRDNSRSSDAISPNFIYGCLGGCMSTYCYVGRYNNDKVYINENTEDILQSILKWRESKPFKKTPNQVDEKYYTIDIGCSTDVALHTKHYNWQEVFSFFNNSRDLKSTFATKYPTKFKPSQYLIAPERNRIRVSLMPQKISDILEPNTDKIYERIASIVRLEMYMEVHINFSPVVIYPEWLQDYEELFKTLSDCGLSLKCEVIFLTYNEIQYHRNTDEVNKWLWRPEKQEKKNSQYANDNIRYERHFKAKAIFAFKQLYSKYFPLSNIRYIF